ncbi:OLC1v1025155C1 [Oldenlandia corymbosa var. corymbosa]|uniref:OLC1v1025155C1 n=1 Tax=Oldenlandia corymbosa var. corymbosa TaxID=529605 RepID=A0AAV1C7F4_OLDCO|nr:OLC1v1025155C1 [Oldenlandia corymbosa var. corymbosa]
MMMMMRLQFSLALFLITFSCVSFESNANDQQHLEGFLSCLQKKSSKDNTLISTIIYTPKNTSFKSALDFYIQNTKFFAPETPKPVAILTPETESQIQSAIFCGKKHGLEMRIRSGGHDFEGNSYVSQVPFFVLDMFNFRSISVNVESKTAWIGAGATLGETYYGIYDKAKTLAFPGGYCPTVGIGGFISGGGYGALTREFGLAADNVVDARIIDANGRILDRESMGEDLFWAIRGGIGSNFGVILSYKVKLVDVPEYVTAFNIVRTTEQNAAELIHKWQNVVSQLPLKLTLSLVIFSGVSPQTGKPTALVIFAGVYRDGGAEKLLQIMDDQFPELGLKKEDLLEMLWIQYFPFHMAQPFDKPKEFLTSRVPPFKFSFAGKSDFLHEPISVEGVEKILNKISELPPFNAQMEWTHFGGGIMDKFPESETPFPHRKTLIMLFESANWAPNDSSDVAETRKNWVKSLHNIVGEYVLHKNPRYAYANYRDYDLGINNPHGETTIEQAKKWGIPYFKDNFDRLVKVKNQVDPENFFRNEQSFPVFPAHSEL